MRRPRRRGRKRRLLKRTTALALLLLVAVLALVLQSGYGQRWVLRTLLDRVRTSLAGELRIEDLRSGSLLTGATLKGVDLTDADGAPVLAADSIVLGYWPLNLLVGRTHVSSIVAWGLELEVSRDRPGGELNLDRVLRPRESDGPPPGWLATIHIDHFGVRDGTVAVRMPEGDESALAHAATLDGETGDGVPASNDLIPENGAPADGSAGLLFRAVDLDLEDVVLSLAGEETLGADLASLALEVSLPSGEEPLVVREAVGTLAFGPGGIQVTGGAFRLPGTLLRGDVGLGPPAPGEGWAFTADVEVDGRGDLDDLRWIDPRIPGGSFSGAARLSMADGVAVTLRGTSMEVEESSVQAEGKVSFGSEMTLDGLTVTADPVALARLEPWLGQELPLDGWVRGRATLSGTPDALAGSGRLTLVPAEVGAGSGPTTVEFSGTFHGGEDPGASALDLRFDPLSYRVLGALAGDAELSGTGSATLELDGRLGSGLRVVADLAHDAGGPTDAAAPDSAAFSRTSARGTLRRAPDGAWSADLSGDLAPLHLDALGGVAPELALRGALRGPVQVRGPLTALQVNADLEVGGGHGVVEGTVNLLDLGSGYRLSVDASALPLSSLSARLPAPSTWTGMLSLEGRGMELDSLAGEATLTAYGARAGGLRIDSVSAVLRADDGVLIADTLHGSFGGVRVVGRGRLGLRAADEGEVLLQFSTSSLVGLRPLLMGDSLLVRDSLSVLDQEYLRFQGVDPDTLPAAEEIRMAGEVHGTATLRGIVSDFAMDVALELQGGAYGRDRAGAAHIALTARGLPELTGVWDVDVDAQNVRWRGRSFDQLSVVGSMAERRGGGTIELERRRTERYTVTGEFALDSIGGEVLVTEAFASIEEGAWTLSGPTRVAWTPTSLTVDSLEVTRPGEDPMRLFATGRVARGGESDMRLSVEGLHLERVTRALQMEDAEVGGHVDLEVTVLGPAESPRIDARLEAEVPRYRNMQLTRLSGSLEYRDRAASVHLEAMDEARTVLSGGGTLPVDLSLGEVEMRRLDGPLDLQMVADSVDAAVALAFLGSFEDVAGYISGDVQVAGTLEEPEPTGLVRIEDAAWTLEALGVRHSGVSGTLTLTPDQIVEVAVGTSASGVSRVTGTVDVSPLSDPTLDLEVSFERFLAIQRRDIEAMISGSFGLSGTYHRPVAEGAITVEEATLYVEEFARSASVVDLTDPTLFGRGTAVDTTVFVTQPLLRDLRNPFLDSLRVDLDLAVPRNTWLRSSDMNVEIGGDLLVRYDRSAGDLVLVGELQALRGTYLVLNRTFEVDEGVVSFIGRPGVNPTLDIQATTRVRRREAEPLEVLARVEGTLVQPRVTLSSEEAGLAQADLVSYIIFGQASAELGRSGQLLNAGFDNQLFSSGFLFVAGDVANRSLAALGANWLDYVAVSAAPGLGENASVSAFKNAQLELGTYISDDLFVVAVVRPYTEDEVSRLGGVRLEWAMTEDYSVEGFYEDRFLRSGSGGFGLAGLNGGKILGMFVFREWGYN